MLEKYILSSFQQIVILFNSIRAALYVICFTLEFFKFLKRSLTIAKVVLSWHKKHIAEDTRVELNQQIIGIQGINIFWNSFNK